MKKIIAILLVICVMISMCACSANNVSTETSSSDTEVKSVSTTVIDDENMFTNRDKEIGYDKNSSINISLNGDTAICSSNAVSINGSTVKISAEGVYVLSGTLNNGQIIIDTDNKTKVQLVLENADINCDTSAAIYVKQADKVFITLDNGTTNTLSNKNEFVAIDENNIDAVIFSKDDLTLNGLGTLNINAEYGHGIVSKNDLVITGGIYTVNSASHAITGKDSVRVADGILNLTSKKDGIHAENTDNASLGFIYVSGGIFNITAETDGIDASFTAKIKGGEFNIISGGGSSNASVKSDGNANEMWGMWGKGNMNSTNNTSSSDSTSISAKGIKTNGNLTIENGTFNLDTSDDSLHSNASIAISDGIINISSGDDGMHADSQTAISRGNIIISKSYEGIEGENIEISGGNISIISSDDGLNASGGSDSATQGARPGAGTFKNSGNVYLKISGGKININASGDGVDSNGNLYVTGGETYVSGPTDNGNGAIDYGDGCYAKITGGIFVAAGSSGMAENFGNTSTQGAILYNASTSQEANSVITLLDNSGNIITSYSPVKKYNSIVISAPQVTQGSTYILNMGSESQIITMTDIIYSNGSFGGFGVGNRGGMPNGVAPGGENMIKNEMGGNKSF